MHFGQAIDSAGRSGFRSSRIGIVEAVNLAMVRFAESPCAAEIDHAHAALHRLRHPLARNLMRRSKKQQINAARPQQLPGKRFERKRAVAIAADLRVEIGERAGGALLARQQQRRFESWVAQQQARQFEAGISGSADHGSLNLGGGWRHSSTSRMRASSLRASRAAAVTIRMVSSPPMVPTISGQPSASMAAATGWALPGAVFITRRLAAPLTRTTNSRSKRSSEGSGRGTATSGTA